MNPQSNDLPAPYAPVSQGSSGSHLSSDSVDASNSPINQADTGLPSKKQVNTDNVMHQPAPNQQSSNSFAPKMAEDADLIEKEWVLRAKAIVSKTKNDPREQSSALNRYKADYIKKRYNKDIKVSEK